MIFYIFILALVMCIAFFGKNKEHDIINHQGQKYILIHGSALVIIGIILICFEGFRNISVGTDTGGYCRQYMELTGRWNFSYEGIKSLLNEPGIYLIFRISSLISDNYWAFLTVASAIMVTCALISIKLNSINEIASLYTYITLAYYLFGFAGIRQALAMGFLLVALTYLYRQHLWKFLLFLGLGAIFHKTLLIFLPFYFLPQLKYNCKNILIIALGAAVIGYSMNILIDWGAELEERYQYYQMETEENSGVLLTLFSLCLTIFYMWERHNIPQIRRWIYDPSLFLLIIATCIYLIVTLTNSNTELNRFAMYFQISSIFLFAEYVAATLKRNITITLIGLCTVQLIYYIVYVSKIGGIMNYKINPYLILNFLT